MPIIEQDFMELTSGLDVAGFWEENRKCTIFTTDKPRCALSFSPDDHWVFEFESISSTIRYYRDKAYRDNLHRRVNENTAEYVGKTFFSEDTWETAPKRIENLFRCEFAYREGGTPWLVPATDSPDEFVEILDEAEKIDLKTWAIPADYRAEWDKRKSAGQKMPALGTGSRGPATIATSVIDPNLLFLWFYDYPDLMHRFSDILAAKMVELNSVLREFSGNHEPGWSITDDNCALFSPDLYQEYCAPVLQTVMAALAPTGVDPRPRRYQHSDSSMAHLLDIQRDLGIREVNYGPEVDPAEIRSKMPDAYIQGQMPPFLLRNGSPEEIRQRVHDDFAAAGLSGGLEIATAGSLAAGTGVGRMRWFMQVVQEECRYGRAAG